MKNNKSPTRKLAILIPLAFVCAVSCLFSLQKVQALSLPPTDPRTSFIDYAPLQIPSLTVPTVVQLSLPDSAKGSVYIFDSTTNTFVGNRKKIVQGINGEKAIAAEYSDDGLTWNPMPSLIDGNSDTFLDVLHTDTDYYALQYPQVTSISGLELEFAKYSAPPINFSIEYLDQSTGKRIPVRVNSSFPSNSISFPTIQTTELYFSLENQQPIRLVDIHTKLANAPISTEQFIQFLAKPEGNYFVYANADKPVQFSQTEAIQFESPDPISILAKFERNPLFQPADQDADGVIDSNDNCPATANSDQKDIDRSSVGDVCEDFDSDTVVNSRDNCPSDSNRAQTDTDGDAIGDTCDSFDNRITERYGWLPWLGIGLAGVVLLFVLVRTIRSKSTDDTDPPTPTDSSTPTAPNTP
jgi:hypothetical protein